MPIDYLGFIFNNEERILSDIIYFYKELKEYKLGIQEDLLKDTYFKAVLTMTIFKQRELDKLQNLPNQEEKRAYLKKRKFKFKPMLFSIFERQIVASKVKAKEKISLNDCIIDYDFSEDKNAIEENKFRFRILVPTTKRLIS